ncbi:MAG: hypothetical protein H0V81_16715, partial [Solirubrobacterales bacterium]|nr:hypothetical protein [Solirubrobacterales bacterium]
ATAAAGTITGAAQIAAASTGTVRGEIRSTIVGKVANTIAQDDVLASASGTFRAGSFSVTATSDTGLTALAKVARNSVTGSTTATIAGISLPAGTGAVSVSATDASALRADASVVVLQAWLPVVTLAATETRNTFARTVLASVTGSTLVTAGALTVSALEDGRLLSLTQGLAEKLKTGTTPISSAKAVAAALAANVYTGSVKALIDASTVSAASVTVSATNDAFVDATSALAASASTDPDAITFKVSILGRLGAPGNIAAGAAVAVNVIGWTISNIALASIDALLGGTEFGTDANPLATEASITASTVTTTGDVTVTATSTATVNATVSNAATTEQHAFFGATSAAAGVVLALNKVNSATRASIAGGGVTAGSALAVIATDAAGIFSNVKVVSSSVTTTDSGVHFLGKAVNGLVTADFTTASGISSVVFGTRVRIVPGYARTTMTSAQSVPVLFTQGVTRVKDLSDGTVYLFVGTTGTGTPSAQDFTTADWVKVAGEDDGIYQYMGPENAGGAASIDLGRTDYTDLTLWKPLAETRIVPKNINFDTSDSRALAGVVVVNDARGSASASITGATILAGSLRVEAEAATTISALADVSSSSAGGSTLTGQGASLAAGGVVAVNRVLGDATASLSGGTVSTTVGGVVVDARNTSEITATNLSAMTSGASSVGVILAFNTVGWKPSNLLFQTVDAILGDPLIADNGYGNQQPARTAAWILGTPVTAMTGIAVGADNRAAITAEISNTATSAPGAIMGAGGMAAAIVIASNMILSEARAFIDTDAVTHVAITAQAGGIGVTARDTASIVASTTLYSEVSPTNDAGAGILNGFVGAFRDDYEFTTSSGTRTVKLGDRVRLADGTVVRSMGLDGVTLDLAESAQDYADYGLWKLLTETNLINEAVQYAALSGLGVVLDKDLTGSAEAYFGLVDHNDVRASVQAWIEDATLSATGAVSVTSEEAASITVTDASHIVPWDGKGAVIATNNVLAEALAWVQNASVSAGAVEVSARTTATLTATASSKIEAFDLAIGFVLAFNTIGWRPSNILFHAVDALLGDPLISAAFNGNDSPSVARAWIRATPVTATGAVSVLAEQAATLISTVGNENRADAVLDGVLSKGSAADGISGGGILASNKVNTSAQAWIDATGATGTITVTGSTVSVVATDAATIESRSTVVQSAITENTAAGIAAFLDVLVKTDYDFTTRSGTRLLKAGDNVRIGPGYAGGGTPGGVYRYSGPEALLNLEIETFSAPEWTRIDTAPAISDYYPNIGNLTSSDARAVGLLVVLNDVRSEAAASIDGTRVIAGALEVRATETSQLLAEATSTVTASGGSFRGGGSVQAINGQLVTNVVLASATATVTGSDLAVGTGGVLVEAVNRAGIDATLTASTATGESAYAFAVAFNSLGWASQNILFNLVDTILGLPLLASERPVVALATVTLTTIRSDGALVVNADGATQLNATVSNAADSTASALWKAEGKSLGGVIASNKVSSAARATLDRVDAVAAGDARITATDSAGVFSNIKIVSSSITTNNGGTAVLQDEINLFLPFDLVSSDGLVTVAFGDRVRITDTPALPAGAAKGQIFTYMGITQAVDLLAADYADRGYWRPVKETNLVPQGLNFTESGSVAFGGAVVLNDVRSDVRASVVTSMVTAATLELSATEAAVIEATNDLYASSSGGSSFTGEGTSLAVNAVIATNRVLSGARATAEDSALTTTTGGIVVSAANTARITATSLSAVETGANAAGIILAFNTIGWAAADLFSSTLDAIIGSPVIAGAAWGGESPSEAIASLTRTTMVSAGGVSVLAISKAQIDAKVSNSATSAPSALMGAGGTTGSAVIASNKVSSKATASISEIPVAAGGGDVLIRADDDAGITAETIMFASVQPSNDAGAGILNGFAKAAKEEFRFTTRSGLRSVVFGDRIRVHEGYAGGGTGGTVYQFMGTDRPLDLGAEDFSVYGFWKELTDDSIMTDAVQYAVLSTIGTVLDKDATGSSASIFGLIAYNDVRSAVLAQLLRAPVSGARDVTVEALERATISASDGSTVESWQGTGGVIVTNVVLASATASVEDGAVSGRDIVVHADDAARITATATSKILGFDRSLGLVAAFNSIGWKSQNLLFNAVDALLGDPLIAQAFGGQEPATARAFMRNAPILASRDVTIRATQRSVVTAIAGNENTAEAQLDAVLASSWATGGLAGGAILASNKVLATAEAFIEFTTGTRTVVATGDLLVSAADAATISSTSTVVQKAITANTAEGLKAFAAGLFDKDFEFSTKSGERLLRTGDKVRVAADDPDKGDVGAVYRYTGPDKTLVDLSATALNLATSPNFQRLAGGASENQLAFIPNLGNLTKSDARAIGILVVLNDLRASAAASIVGASVTARGVAVFAEETTDLSARATNTAEASGGSFYGTGTVLGGAGTMVTNLILSSAKARITDATVTVGAGGVAVEARDTSLIDATVHTAATSGETALGFTLAFNTIGWKSQNVLFNLIDAIIGDPAIATAFGNSQPAETTARVSGSSLTSAGSIGISAHNAAQVNATISNAADSAASALWGAKGSAIGGAVSSNKVATLTDASFTDGRATATGTGTEISVTAEDVTGIFANVKLVVSSVTTNDGGASLLQGVVNAYIPADYLSTETDRIVRFGQRVRLVAPPEDFGSGDGVVELGTGNRVRVADDFGVFRLTSASGKRLLITGDNVQRASDAAVFRYLGANGRVDLGATNFGDASLWKRLGGDPGALYQWTGTAGTVDLAATDYTAPGWILVGGRDGVVYQWMGPDGTTATDFGAADFTDLRFWKPVPRTSLVPQGINVTTSDSMAVGGIIVLNDVRTVTTASIADAVLSAPSVRVEVVEAAFIRATADSSVTSSGGSSFTGKGSSLAVNAVIATNVILMTAGALVDRSAVTTTAGDLEVTAQALAQVDATALNSTDSAGQSVGVTLAFNTIGWKSQNFLFNAIDTLLGDPIIANAFGNSDAATVTAFIRNSGVSSARDTRVVALNESLINADMSNVASAAAVAFTGATALAVGIVLASNMVNSTAQAGVELAGTIPAFAILSAPALILPGQRVRLADGSVYVNISNGARGPPATPALFASDPANWRLLGTVTTRDLEILSEDRPAIDATIDVRSIAKASNDGGLSVFTALVSAGEKDYTYTQQSGLRQLLTGQTVRRDSDGAVFRYKVALDPETAPVVDIGSQVLTDTTKWVKLDKNLLEKLVDLGINVTPSDATAVAGLAARNDVRGGAISTLSGVTVTASGAIVVDASQNASIHAENKVIAEAAGGGATSVAVGVNIATNVVLSGAQALVDAATLTATGSIAVTAANTSAIDATITSAITTKTTGVGITLAFNSIGRAPSNILFNLVDAVVGTDIGGLTGGEQEFKARTTAIVRDSTLDAGTSITIAAVASTTITARVLASVVSISANLGGSTQIAIGIVVAMNRLSTLVEASASSRTLLARAGNLTVSSRNASVITSDVSAPTVAVGVNLGSATKVAVGVSISRNVITDDVKAFLNGVTDARATSGAIAVTASNAAVIEASSRASAISVAVSAGSATGFAGGGATAVNKIDGGARAEAIGSSLTATGAGGTVTISVVNTMKIDAVVAAVAAAVGAGGSGAT